MHFELDLSLDTGMSTTLLTSGLKSQGICASTLVTNSTVIERLSSTAIALAWASVSRPVLPFKPVIVQNTLYSGTRA